MSRVRQMHVHRAMALLVMNLDTAHALYAITTNILTAKSRNKLEKVKQNYLDLLIQCRENSNVREVSLKKQWNSRNITSVTIWAIKLT